MFSNEDIVLFPVSFGAPDPSGLHETMAAVATPGDAVRVDN